METNAKLANKVSELDMQIGLLKNDLEVAESAIEEASEDIRKSTQMASVMKNQSKLQMAINAKKRASTELQNVEAKKAKLKKK